MQTDFQDFDPLSPGGGMPAPGKCQLLVTDVEEHDSYVSVTHQIVAHEDPAQVGKTNYNNLSVSGKAAKRAFLFAFATGILTKEEVAEAKVNGTSLDIDFKAAEGCVYYGTLEESEYNGKKKVRVEWDFRAMDDPGVDEYPFDPEFTPDRVEKKPEPKAPAKPATKDPAALAAAAAAKAKAKAAEKKAAAPPKEDIPF